MDYEVYTLKGKEILQGGKVEKNTAKNNYEISFEFDFTDIKTVKRKTDINGDDHSITDAVKSFDYRRLVSGLSRKGENAFFYQIEQILKEQDLKPEDIRKKIVYLDFGDIRFTTNIEKKKTLTKEDLKTELPQTEGVLHDAEENAEWSDAEKTEFDFMSEYESLYYSKKLKRLFESGMTIRFNENESVHFIPSEKSASMAKKSVIAFVDDTIVEDLNKRLTLGLDFSDTQVTLSKWYAYRGLYLSDSKRIESDDLVLDEKSVIVINPDLVNLKNVFSVSMSQESGNKWKAATPGYEDIKDVDPWDGEGLIMPDYMAKINRRLREKSDENDAVSIQIRLPFGKGMLHQVDFLKMLKDKNLTGLSDEQLDGLMITDIFGILRSVRDVKIILTESMFKCGKWLKKIQNKKHKADENYDPMKAYFEGFKKYNHALYIAGSTLNLSKCDHVALNYQFINTLALSQEQLVQLADHHYNHIAEMSTASVFEEKKQKENEGDESENPSHKMPLWEQALKKNIRFQADTAAHSRVNGMKRSLERDVFYGRILVPGKLCYLSGDLLSLFYELVFNIRKTMLGNGLDPFSNRRLKKISKNCLFDHSFYTPNDENLEKDKFYGILRSPHLARNEQVILKYCGDLQSVYNQYFGHLKGVLMTGRLSTCAQALAGADFDGDKVKLIVDETVNAAIKNGVYIEKNAVQKKKNGSCIENNDTQQKKEIFRKLPVSVIKPPKGSFDRNIPETVDFETCLNTFANSIGQISNYAIKSGKNFDYASAAEEEGTYPPFVFTILTGLEIDAAKTGQHPDLSDILSDRKKEPYLKKVDTFEEVDKKKQIEVKWIKYTPGKTEKTEQGEESKMESDPVPNPEYAYQVAIVNKKQPQSPLFFVEDPGKLTSDAADSDKDSGIAWFGSLKGLKETANIDLLPIIFCRHNLYEPTDTDGASKDSNPSSDREKASVSSAATKNTSEAHHPVRPKHKFKFEEESKWRSNLDPEIQNKCAAVIIAYRQVLKMFTDTWKQENIQYGKLNNASKINTLLSFKYDRQEDVKKRFNDIFLMAEAMLPGVKKPQDALRRLIQKSWPYYERKEGKEEKTLIIDKDALSAILLDPNQEDGEASSALLNSTQIENAKKTLCDCRHKGYNILYYLIKDIILAHRYNFDPDELYQNRIKPLKAGFEKNAEEKVTATDVDLEQYEGISKDLFNIFKACHREKQDKKSLIAALNKSAEKAISDIFEECKGSDQDTAFLRYAHYLRNRKYLGEDKKYHSIDGSGSFFWSYFDDPDRRTMFLDAIE